MAVDYVLKGKNNSFAAITAHLGYWENPDLAFFVLNMLQKDTEKK